MASRDDLIYLAGFFDGEGSVMAKKGGLNCLITLSISNTDLDVLQWIAQTFGGQVATHHNPTPYTRKNAWKWELHGEAAIKLLQELIPFLKTKKERAQIAITYPLYKRGIGKLPKEILQQRTNLWFELRRLNRRGPVEMEI